MKTPAVLAGSLIVLAAVYTGSAWYVGMEAENTIRATVEQSNQRIAKTLGAGLGYAKAQVVIEDYQRGLFSSTARYNLVLEDESDKLELALHDHMQHGPFPWALVQQGQFSPQLAYSRSELVDTEAVKRWFDAARGAMPLKADTRIGFNGEGHTEWQFAPLEWVTDEDSLSFSGGQVAVDFSNDFQDSHAQGHFASLILGSGGASGDTVSLRDIGVDSRTHKAGGDAIQMNSRVEIDQIAVDTTASESLTLNDIAFVIESDQKAELLNAGMQYDIQRMMVGEIDLGSLTLGGQLKSFNVEAFSALMAEYDAIAREHGAENGEDFDLSPDDETRLIARLVPLLASSPEVILAPVSWSNDEGETALTLNMAFQPLPASDTAAQGEALEDALRELSFQLTLSRPMLLNLISRAAGGGEEGRQFEMFAALIFDNYIAQLQQQGLVKLEGDNATVSIDYKDDHLTLNGEPTSIEDLMYLFAQLGL